LADPYHTFGFPPCTVHPGFSILSAESLLERGIYAAAYGFKVENPPGFISLVEYANHTCS
jgi:hypothetical protein